MVEFLDVLGPQLVSLKLGMMTMSCDRSKRRGTVTFNKICAKLPACRFLQIYLSQVGSSAVSLATAEDCGPCYVSIPEECTRGRPKPCFLSLLLRPSLTLTHEEGRRIHCARGPDHMGF